MVIPLEVLLLLRIVFAIQGLLLFQMNLLFLTLWRIELEFWWRLHWTCRLLSANELIFVIDCVVLFPKSNACWLSLLLRPYSYQQPYIKLFSVVILPFKSLFPLMYLLLILSVSLTLCLSVLCKSVVSRLIIPQFHFLLYPTWAGPVTWHLFLALSKAWKVHDASDALRQKVLPGFDSLHPIPVFL